EVETVQTLTADRALLLEALSRLSPRDLPTDFPAVVETLSQIARGLDSPDLWIIGDASHGGIEDISGEAERFQYRYVPVGESVANVGIVQADVRRTYGHEVRSELFARIASTFDEATQWTVRLLWEDRIADAREVSLDPKGREGVVFDVSSLKAGRVTLEIEAEDGFPLDDRVVLFIEDPQPIRVLIVGEENPWLDDVLRSSTEVRSARVAKESFPPAELEREILEANPPVVVFDRWLPETIPPAPAIFIGCRPNDGTASVDYAERDWPAIVDWDRLHPVLRDLAFESVRIRRGEVATGAGVGFHCLVDAADGCLVSAQTRPRPGGGTVAAIVLGFDILESNWPLGHFSFPLFFDNAISWLGQAETQRRSRWATGETLVASPRDIARSGVVVEFRDPAGDKRSAVVDSSGRALFGRLERAGIHELLVDGKVVDRFAANLLDASESNLEPRLLKASAEDGDAAGESGAPAGPVVAETSIRASRDLWPWFALAALALVLIEWYVYHRRTYI
ncbi:MAG TPA: hypothetical protein VK116_07375, partial [Planctomycetota bacterium]|nr:hypothetical protein [Planctomycetota bacterium]